MKEIINYDMGSVAMRVKSEKYLADLMFKIGEAMDEIEQGGLRCSTNAYIDMRHLWESLSRWDGLKPRKAE
jgi:hypothetical protein